MQRFHIEPWVQVEHCRPSGKLSHQTPHIRDWLKGAYRALSAAARVGERLFSDDPVVR